MTQGAHPEASAVTVVIPARFGSTRFPGKPLALLEGRPLIQHVYERVPRLPEIQRVLVATDDARIHAAVTGFGGESLLLEGEFRTGTDRVAEVARRLEAPILLNLQGDEVILQPDLLGDLIGPFLDSTAGIGTLKRRMSSPHALANPSIVKVITTVTGDALYFSRAPIPHTREAQAPGGRIRDEGHYMHLGIYIFRRDTLLRFADLPTGALEEREQLEQLRALEHGLPIRVWETTCPSLRIDTPDDLEHAKTVFRQEEVCAEAAHTQVRDTSKGVAP